MGKYAKIKTEFVRRQLRGTSWALRAYIDELIKVEQIAARGGPKSFAEGMLFNRIRQKIPAAVHAIFAEIVEGKVLTDEELSAWQQERWRKEEAEHRALALEREREKAEAARRLQEERREWLAMGGRP